MSTGSKSTSAGDMSALCQSCGACCAYDASWPRFSLETEAEIARIPAALVDVRGSGMRCEGVRCAALTGKVGKATACSIYDRRPQVCRDCVAGDDACRMARAAHGLPPLPEPGAGPA